MTSSKADSAPISVEQYESLLTDCSAAWDACEKRRLQAEEYRARAYFAESHLLSTGANEPLFQAYAARYPIPTPEKLPEIFTDV